MKLTRRELVDLVEAAVAHPRGDLGKNIADVEFPILVGYEGVSEIAYNQDELDNILDTIADEGIPYSLDALEDVEAQDLPAGAGIEMMEKITITKSKLSDMIRRSVHKRVEEQVVGYKTPSEVSDESDAYLTTGSTSMAAKQGSQEEEDAADTSTRELTQQRQQQLNKGNAVTADDTGRQLQDLLNQKNENKMKVTKRQLKRIIRESCELGSDSAQALPEMLPAAVEPPTDGIPAPEDYNMVRDMLEQNPEIVDFGISAVMDMVGTGCERSTAQGIIDHLQDVVLGSSNGGEDLVQKASIPSLPIGDMEMIKGPGFGGNAW
jgi:hypothetical protein